MAAGVPGEQQAADVRGLLLDDAQPFGDDGKAVRIHVPRFEFGVQRLQPDLFVPPLVLARGTLRLVYRLIV